jgi:hypothetical protein
LAQIEFIAICGYQDSIDRSENEIELMQYDSRPHLLTIQLTIGSRGCTRISVYSGGREMKVHTTLKLSVKYA